MKFFFSVIFAVFFVINCAHAQPLAESPEWHSLLHIRDDNKSDINDPKFFLSNPFSPENEFNIAISELRSDKKDEMLCRFPARYRYLNKKLDLNITFDHCTNLNEFLKDSRGESVSMSFASSYLGSPISYFGHTFITIHKTNNRFFSQTLSFAAEIPQEVGFIDLLSKGIRGGFNGKFVAEPYFKLHEGYNIVEQRSLSEYRLNLTQDEIENMLWHAYELYDANINYKFFTENCAYEMLWFLEVARPGLKLRENFPYAVIPYETINEIKKAGLVMQIDTQPPLINSLHTIYNGFTAEEKDFFSRWKNSGDKKEELESINLSNETKDKLGYLINGYYDILFKRFHQGKGDFEDVKQLPYTPPNERYIGEPIRHGSSKIEVGYLQVNGVEGLDLNVRPILFNRIHDLYSELGDGTLEFLGLEMRRIENKTSLQSFTLLKIESLTKRFDFYHPVSWKIYAGADRSLKDSSLQPLVQVGSGVSYGTSSLLWYGMGQATVYPLKMTAGIEVLAGLSYWNGLSHIGIDFREPVFFTGRKSKGDFEAYFTTPITKKIIFKIWGKNQEAGIRLVLAF
ncbi:DUF4105 domain-containing protein [Candidatus Sulfurimonas baltica]|uniref:DUF4105 domain-containing protein n=1 Tax=Candidatus Sulfurimonas baltica TaxID=2740404 RepID=A0A7S7LWA5_9BACT|nr:DUF4105 domain-containing protein [Candidatus Sulfurimonas baltica]QOY52023.1 DUF4105 domain-containing protein [Candidatus Sulfurimonas baltica]